MDLDQFIDNLLQTSKSTPMKLQVGAIRELLSQSLESLSKQPSLLELDAPLTICGDIHGQFSDLLRVFDLAGHVPRTRYLWLGDYVDRGKDGIETMCLLLALQLRFPEHLYLLRGNHECHSIARIYGFFDECKRKYRGFQEYKAFVGVFNLLPIAAVVGGKIFCCHGGLSPALHSLDQIRAIQRPIDVPEEGLLCDLLWSRPGEDGCDSWEPSPRGIGLCFSESDVTIFLETLDMDLVCRSHSVPDAGYEFFGSKRELVTIFTAPQYCGERNNRGGMMKVDEALMCSFQVFS